MTKSIPPNLDEIPQSGTVDEIKALIRLRQKTAAFLRNEEKKEKGVIARAKRRRQLNSKTQLETLKEVDTRLAELLQRRKRYLWSRHGKTIRFPGGTIRYVEGPRSLDTPKNTAAIIAKLLSMRGGKRHLRIKWELERDSLTNTASESMLRALKPLGVWVGKHSLISVKSDGDEEPTILVRRRFHAPQK